MLKAIFLDMDETLCDTTKANNCALDILSNKVYELFPLLDSKKIAANYLSGIYRNLSPEYQAALNPIKDESEFRIALFRKILNDAGIKDPSLEHGQILQNTFDKARTEHFDFYPTIKEWLIEIRKKYTLVLITNGPEYSQTLKIERVAMHKFVDHIIIGGQEKEQKPAISIFHKAMRLANCSADETIHIGDSLEADILGANQSGVASVWISHKDSKEINLNQKLALDITPKHTLATPYDIPTFFENFVANIC